MIVSIMPMVMTMTMMVRHCAFSRAMTIYEVQTGDSLCFVQSSNACTMSEFGHALLSLRKICASMLHSSGWSTWFQTKHVDCIEYSIAIGSGIELSTSANVLQSRYLRASRSEPTPVLTRERTVLVAFRHRTCPCPFCFGTRPTTPSDRSQGRIRLAKISGSW